MGPIHTTRALVAPAFLLGFALGGFFDGIVLHQILQWHHLLILVDSVRDLRAQVLADGAFHALMYLLAAAALALLWRRRTACANSRAGRALAVWGLVGFGVWNVVDAVLAHWLVGLHRIRLDSANPLAWDIGWLAVFGLLPLLAAWWLSRRPLPPGRASGGGRAAAALALAALLAGPWAAWPGGGLGGSTASAGAARASQLDRQALVLFAPGVAPGQALQALAAVDARVLWVDRSGGLWAVQLAPAQTRAGVWALAGHGALLLRGRGGLGCAGFSRAV